MDQQPQPNHREYQIGIAFDKSPEYVDFFNQSNNMMDQINQLQATLIKFKPSLIHPFKNDNRAKEIIKKYKSTIEPAFTAWSDNAYNFIYHAKYTVEASDELSHIVASIQAYNAAAFRLNQVYSEGQNLKSNVYKLLDNNSTIKVFWFTYLALILSVFFGFTGMILGIISLFK
jgi:hypothetical protein